MRVLFTAISISTRLRDRSPTKSFEKGKSIELQLIETSIKIGCTKRVSKIKLLHTEPRTLPSKLSESPSPYCVPTSPPDFETLLVPFSFNIRKTFPKEGVLVESSSPQVWYRGFPGRGNCPQSLQTPTP